ncbi:MAG: methylated-DNA--[protein]-cysteine S-methyltransferase [Comamonadaceae bacterium]|nr:MAG: methylated-DNA--[protein]-cysteine S-methyltransferase [Comamonadaceae bacterium]
MTAGGCALFPSAIGVLGIAWREDALVAVQLPEATSEATRERMLRWTGALPEATPPTFVQAAIDGVQALMQGVPIDLCDVPLDMRGVPAFHRRVYEVARRIPPGRTATYGEVAVALGDKGLSRAVGQALGHNPFAPIVPCHRVLAAGNRPGGFSGGAGPMTKLRMLEIEGARPNGMDSLFQGSWG